VSGGVSRVVGRDDGGTLWDAPNCPEDEGLCSLAAKEQESPPYDINSQIKCNNNSR